MEVLVVRYEDIVRHPYRELSRLSNFLGLCVIDEQMKQVIPGTSSGHQVMLQSFLLHKLLLDSFKARPAALPSIVSALRC